jgi:hypothetical protein
MILIFTAAFFLSWLFFAGIWHFIAYQVLGFPKYFANIFDKTSAALTQNMYVKLFYIGINTFLKADFQHFC